VSVVEALVPVLTDSPPDAHSTDMIRIFGGTFRMGSDKHYPEEAPAHRVTVGDFLIDRTPVTSRHFKEFVRATGYVTFAGIVIRERNGS